MGFLVTINFLSKFTEHISPEEKANLVLFKEKNNCEKKRMEESVFQNVSIRSNSTKFFLNLLANKPSTI